MARPDPAALSAIERLNADFCFELDRGTPEGFAALFTRDADYSHGARVSHGRDAILAFARSRTAHGPRTSRHLLTGLRVTVDAPGAASGVSCCVTFAASAEPPIPSTAVLLVADFHDRYVQDGDRWLIASRRIVPIFVPAAERP